MNTKTIVGIVIVILIALGGYFAYVRYSSPSENTGVSGQNVEDVVQAQDTVVGNGAEAVPGSIVSILYVGRLADGTVFDSSEAHGDEPLTFQLGTPGIIAGFQIGVNGMREGGERTMAIPPTFGYGGEDVKDPEGNVVIPANSTIIFEVKLLKVEPAPVESAPAPEAE